MHNQPKFQPALCIRVLHRDPSEEMSVRSHRVRADWATAQLKKQCCHLSARPAGTPHTVQKALSSRGPLPGWLPPEPLLHLACLPTYLRPFQLWNALPRKA